MKYFIPDWEDRLDPRFDFEADTFSRPRKAARQTDMYAHELFDPAPYDGIVVSLASFTSKRRLTETANGEVLLGGCRSAKEYFRTDRACKEPLLMGDCGAFEYVNKKTPPAEFNTGRVARIYEALGFDYGISVDHMVVDRVFRKTREGQLVAAAMGNQAKEERRLLSVQNAKDFWRYHRKRGFRFVPLGATQGLDPESYANSAGRLLEIGYRYLAVGSLVPKTNDEILRILRAINKEIAGSSRTRRAHIKLHLLGVLRVSLLEAFAKLRVVSFDSASYLRKAWLRSGMNYLSPDLDWFAAIRVPYSDSTKLVENAHREGISIEELKRMEQTSLDLLRLYDRGKVSLKKVLATVLGYDQLLLRDYDGNHHGEKYARTLEAKPWKECPCPVCRALGIDVAIFRGANRNKRRGFHNTFIFFDKILNGKTGKGGAKLVQEHC